MREDVLNTRQFLVAGGSFDSIESCSRPHSTASICDKICTASEAVATRRISFFRSCALKLHRRSLIFVANRFRSPSWFTLRRGSKFQGSGRSSPPLSSRQLAMEPPSARAESFAAWLGLVPRQYSKGGKARLLGISKRGNPYLRKILVHGARAAVLRIKRDQAPIGAWMDALERGAHRNVLIVAFANKLARIAPARARPGGESHAYRSGCSTLEQIQLNSILNYD